ncbi:MAG: hypothetical protein HYV96_17255 [Opitutae bacterium]|nr:hypothetical protein [Opitutae bacterium]
MTTSEPSVPSRPRPADWVARAFFFVLLALVIFTFPFAPANELDSSWRMVLGQAFHDRLQFGVDIVFTYGPLGFLMGKTYTGLYYNTFLVWQAAQALVVAALIFRLGLRLSFHRRYIYFAFFILLGATYEDALHQMAIGLMGFELLRRHDEKLRVLPALFAALFAVLGLVKFTNLMLATVFVICVAALHLWHRRRADALWILGWGAGSYLLGWVLCGQNLLNLPDYFFNSWEISQGYQETMGIPTPPEGLIAGLVTVGLVLTYLVGYVSRLQDRARAIVTAVAFCAYVLLNWKHGFVRADGHMIGFFFVVMVPAVAFPVLLGDGDGLRRWQRGLTVALAVSCLVGVGVAIPGLMRGVLNIAQERVFGNADKLLHPAESRGTYDYKLQVEQTYFDLPKVRAVVGHGTLDVFGFELAVALYNKFNYHPRPVIQSYSAYRPHLSRLNLKFYSSDRAPEFVLFKLQSIDRRLVTFDDSEVLSLLLHRYEYVLTERGLQLWRRKPGPFSRGSIAPKPIRTVELAPGQPCLTEDLVDRHLWATVDLRPSLLGRLRGFLYKLPIVTLRIETTQGVKLDYRMPLPQGRTGFIVNPIVEDLMGYMNFAGGKPERFLRSLTVVLEPGDEAFFADGYRVTLSELPPSNAGQEFFAQEERNLFRMFSVTPASYSAMTPVSEGVIEGKPVMVFHAPSELIVNVPAGATKFAGAFGILEGAYTNGNSTDGAIFTATWIRGADEVLVLEQALDPVQRLKDRALQTFEVSIPPGEGARLRLRTNPGPNSNYAWDWTAWTALRFK